MTTQTAFARVGIKSVKTDILNAYYVATND
jgi:hypothetical protein